MRLLFASIHSYLDPSSGAALATRELLELLAARAMDCRVVCAGVLDYERETSLDEVLATLGLPAQRSGAELGGGRSATVSLSGVSTAITTIAYDAEGQKIQVTDPLGRVTCLGYNNRGGLATVTDPLGNTTTYAYTATGMTSSITNPNSSGGSTDSYLCDADDRLTTFTDPPNHSTVFGYDPVGITITIKDANNNTTSYAYDSADRLATMTDPLGHAATYAYNYDDQLTDATDRDGRRRTYSYDSGGRVTGETWLDSSGGTTNLVSYGYDADSELTSTRAA
jgi:YD repeat-containing protein